MRGVRAFGLRSAVVPADFPLALADRLRAEGVELTPDDVAFEQRRRRKSDAEMAGIRRADRRGRRRRCTRAPGCCARARSTASGSSTTARR